MQYLFFVVISLLVPSLLLASYTDNPEPYDHGEFNINNAANTANTAAYLNSIINENQRFIGHLEDLPVHAIFSNSAGYIGSLTEIFDQVYIGSAHVIDKLDKQALERLQKAYSVGSRYEGQIEVFQLHDNWSPRDIVILFNPNQYSTTDIKNKLLAISDTAEPGQNFKIKHLSFIEQNIVSQLSTGPISISFNNKTLFMASEKMSILSHGSSGSLVFVNTRERTFLAGIVQCVVLGLGNESNSSTHNSYFRGISLPRALSGQFIQVNFDQLQANKAHYQSQSCDPVGGKDGGG